MRFEAVMNCMPSRSASVDPYLNTMQWSRRFVGLRLFLGLATAGWEGYAKHVEKCVCLSRTGCAVNSPRMAGPALNSSPLAVFVLAARRLGAPDARAIADAIVADGVAWISTVAFEGETAVRICITSGEDDRSGSRSVSGGPSSPRPVRRAAPAASRSSLNDTVARCSRRCATDRRG